MNHYYNAYPMMNGGQPSLEAGGEATENPDQSFYVNKMQNFISKLQQNGQKALMKSIETVDEDYPMSGMRHGGIPKYQSDKKSGEYSIEEASGGLMLDPNNPNYENNRRDQIGGYIFGDDGSGSTGTTSTTKGTGTSGGVSTSVAPAAKPAPGSTGKTKATAPTSGTAKPAAKSSSGTTAKSSSGTGTSTTGTVSTGTTAATGSGTTGTTDNTGTTTTTGTGNTTNTGTTGIGTTGTTSTNADGEFCYPDGTCFINGTPPGVSIGNTTSTGTTGTTGWEGWRMVTLPDGRRVPVDSQDRVYFDNPYQSGPQYYNYGQPQQQNYGNFLDYIPGGGLRRKSANLLLGTAMANNDLSQYEIDPRSIKTRRAILPGNRIKSFDLVKKGTSSGPITSNLQTETAKTTQVPTIQDEGTFQSAMPSMTTEQKVQTANDWNYRPNQPSYIPAAPVIGPEGPTRQPSMMSTGDAGFDYSSFQQSNPNADTQVNTQGSPTFDKNNPQHREAMLKGIMEGMSPAAAAPSTNTAALIGELSNMKGEYWDQILYDGRTKREHLIDDLNSGDPAKMKQANYEIGVHSSEFKRYGGPYALPMFQTDIFSGENPFGGVQVNADPNPVQDLTWDTGNGYADLMAEQARMIERENDPFKTTEDRLPLKFKRQGPFANLSADQMIAGIDSAAGILNKYANWNQENMDFNTAKQVHGVSNAPNSTGSHVLNPVAIGPSFDPRNYNSNLRGMYAQYGGQGFYTGDNYYLTMPTIKNVKKAGAFKPGK
jgi:hypothetical protein